MYSVIERKNHGSQIRDNGRDYEKVQAVQCCKKAAYGAFNTSRNNTNPVAYFETSVNDIFEHALRDLVGTDMVGITIQNQVNQNDKPIRISFRRKYQLPGDVIWSVYERVSQSNSRINALDTIVVTVHSVKMPAGFDNMQLRVGADRSP